MTGCSSRVCYIYDRLGITGRVFVGAVLGALIGSLLNEYGYDEISLQIFAFPGVLWMRSLRLVVLPLIFANMTVALARY